MYCGICINISSGESDASLTCICISGSVMTADIKRGLTGGRGRGLQRSVSSVSGLSPRARPICGVRAVTGVYRYSVQVQCTGVQVSVQVRHLRR